MNQWERTPHLIYIRPFYDLKGEIRRSYFIQVRFSDDCIFVSMLRAKGIKPCKVLNLWTFLLADIDNV
jgi:hypothetical protein